MLLLAVLLASSSQGCAGTTTLPVRAENTPIFSDDASTDSLRRAATINLAYLAQQPPGKTVRIAGRNIPMARLHRTVRLFLDILAQNPSPASLDRHMKERFDIFQAAGRGRGNDGEMLVTGYYQPVFAGSLTRGAPYLYPLYGVPPDLVQGSKDLAYGRLEKGKLVPYWSRAEIERGQRAAGHELVWLADPVDAFLVHVQGSAIIRLPDNSRRGIHFAAKNGHPYRSIGGHLVQSGRLNRDQATTPGIRAYLAAHPAERDEILHANPSFIFFSWTDTPAVIGSLGRELTAGRSVAADQDCFPGGTLGFLVSRRPTVEKDNSVRWTPLNRFVMVQDSGSAITGSGRIDLFMGTGPEAGAEAGLMREDGMLYFFLAKEGPAREDEVVAAAGPAS